jgi:hypothetical protein
MFCSHYIKFWTIFKMSQRNAKYQIYLFVWNVQVCDEHIQLDKNRTIQRLNF